MGNIQAAQLIREYNDYIESIPNHRFQKYLSYGHRDKILKAVIGMSWDDVEKNKSKIDTELRESGSKRGVILSDKTLELAWCWLARAFEYAAHRGIIPVNRFRGLIPKSRTSSTLFD